MPHPLADHPLPGIDPPRLEQLSQAGLASLEDVIDAGPERLSEVTGFDLKTSRALVRVAASALAHHDAEHNPDIIRLTPLHDEPSASRLVRGLQAARAIEQTLSCARKARSWTKADSAERASHAKRRRRARRQLRKLIAHLEELQQSVLSDGLSQKGQDHLLGELTRFESAAGTLLADAAERRTLKHMRRLAKDVRYMLIAPLQ